MTTEKRNHRRLKPQGMQAGVIFNTIDQEITLNADILDISYTGIRVKLKEPIASDIIGHIKITMTLPESGTSFSVHGILKHKHNESECGLHYIEHIEGSIDDVMFECIELDNSTVFIKTH
jgi:hypothetical protein